MKTRGWLLLFAAALLLCGAAAWIIGSAGPGGAVVGIYRDGKLVKSVDLSAVAEPYDIVLEGPGSCVVRVEPGSIYMLSSTCPDQLCVGQGALKGPPVVCLPNRVVLRYLGETDMGYDAMTGSLN